MINGNINEFIDKLWGGEELIYTHNGKKYFPQGYMGEDGRYRFELQQWEPEGKLLWHVEGLDHQSSLDTFLSQPLFDGKTFWEVEPGIECNLCRLGEEADLGGCGGWEGVRKIVFGITPLEANEAVDQGLFPQVLFMQTP